MKRENILGGRIVFSLIILALYLAGRVIPIPWVVQQTAASSAGFQSVVSGVLGSGGTVNVLSLGLTPWIFASILVQTGSALRGGDRRRASKSSNGRLTIAVAFVIALIQALIRAAQLQMSEDFGLPGAVLRALTALVLTAGAMGIVWLCHRNEAWGVGGQRLIIAVNLVTTAAGLIRSSLTDAAKQGGGALWKAAGLLLLLAAVICAVTMYCERKELRLPVCRILIDPQYAADDYYAIKLNPVGTMPVMYAMTVLSVLDGVLPALEALLPQAGVLSALENLLDIDTLPGVLLFGALIWILNLAASMVMLDPKTMSEDLLRSGDYLQGVKPGEETYRVLRGTILKAAVISSAVMCALSLPPLLLQTLPAADFSVGTLPVTLMMLSGVLAALLEEARVYRALGSYPQLLQF